MTWRAGNSSSAPPPAASDSSPTPSRTTQPPPGWDSGVLKAVEGHLARFVGPVAKVMIKRAGLQTTDLDALYGILAENLATDAERKQFLATFQRCPAAEALVESRPGLERGSSHCKHGTGAQPAEIHEFEPARRFHVDDAALRTGVEPTE